jgi:hypothetical protein
MALLPGRLRRLRRAPARPRPRPAADAPRATAPTRRPQVFTHKNGRSAGCATIEFKQHSEACQALIHMRTSTLHGKDIEIQWFNPHLAADPAYKAKAQAGEHHHGLAGSPRIPASYHNPFNMAALQGQQVLFPSHVYNAAAEAAVMVQQAAVQHAMQQEIVAAAAAAAAYQEAVQQAAMQQAAQQGGSQQEQLLASMYAANAAAAAVVAQAAGHPELPGDGSEASVQVLLQQGGAGMKGLPAIRTVSGHMSPELARRPASANAGAAPGASRQGSPYSGYTQPGSPVVGSPSGWPPASTLLLMPPPPLPRAAAVDAECRRAAAGGARTLPAARTLRAALKLPAAPPGAAQPPHGAGS